MLYLGHSREHFKKEEKHMTGTEFSELVCKIRQLSNINKDRLLAYLHFLKDTECSSEPLASCSLEDQEPIQ